MSKTKELFFAINKQLIKNSKESLLSISGTQKKGSFLLEKLGNLRIETTAEERKQFSVFNINSLLSGNSLEAKIKKNLFIYGLRNSISILEIKDIFNELENQAIPFVDAFYKEYLQPFLLEFEKSNQQNQKIITRNNDVITSIIFQNKELYKLDEELFHWIKTIRRDYKGDFNNSSFLTFIGFAKYHVGLREADWGGDKMCFFPNTLSQLFNMPIALLTKLLTNANNAESASFEKGFGIVHYDTGSKQKSNNTVLDFEYETEEEIKEAGSKKKQAEYQFSLKPDHLENLDKFFVSFSNAVERITESFENQMIGGEFTYNQATYEKVSIMVSRWLKYALLYFHIEEELENLLVFEKTYENILFFLEYFQFYSGMTASTFYKHPEFERKIGLISYYTDFSKEIFDRNIRKTNIDVNTLNNFYSMINNELYFEIFSYNAEKNIFNALINPLKSLEGGSMLVYKFLIKKISFLQNFNFGSEKLPSNIEEISRLYLSNKLNYKFILSQNGDVKSILHCKDKEFKIGETPKEEINDGFFSGLKNLFTKKEEKIEPLTPTITQGKTFESQALHQMFNFFPLQHCSNEILKSPYFFLKNYQNPLYPLHQFYKFNTQSFYQVLKIKQKISYMKGISKLLFGVVLKNINIKALGFDLPFGIKQVTENISSLQKFNSNLPSMEIYLQSLVTVEMPLEECFPELLKQDKYTLFLKA